MHWFVILQIQLTVFVIYLAIFIKFSPLLVIARLQKIK